MELAKAIKAVAPFAAKEGDGVLAAHTCIRLYGRDGGHQSYVAACDGQSGILIPVDEDIPDALVQATDLAKISGQSYTKHEIREGRLYLGTGEGRWFDVALWDSASWPPLPDMPDVFEDAPHWAQVVKLESSAGDSKGLESLEFVRLATTKAMATDAFQVGKVDCNVGIEGIFPVSMLKKWPAGARVELGVTKQCLWARLASGQMRWGYWHEKPLPEMTQFVPDIHKGGPAFVVERPAFQAAVKQAIAAAHKRSIALEFSRNRIHVRAYTEDDAKNFEANIEPVEDGYEFDPTDAVGHGTENWVDDCFAKLLFDGKRLLDVLKALKTPNIRIAHAGVDNPIRLESGAFVATIWPQKV